MQIAPLHPQERQRLDALARLGLLDSPPEERFDRITRLAAAVLETPIAVVSLVDSGRQWFKSRVGLAVAETPRDMAFCAHAILGPGARAMVVGDAATDARFADNPLVVKDPNIRFYAGQVVHSPDGMPLGTLCVIDRKPREFSELQLGVLADLGALVEAEIARQEGEALLVRLDESERVKSSILTTLTEGLVLRGPGGEVIEWNRAAERLLGLSGEELSTGTPRDPRWRAARPDGTAWPMGGPGDPTTQDERIEVHRPDGTRAWLDVSTRPTVGPRGERRALTVIEDVTDKLGLESALRASEQAARASLDALEQGVILTDSTGAIQRLNPAAERLLGYTPTELTERWRSGQWQAFDENWVPVPADRSLVGRAAAGEHIHEEIVGWLRKDGGRVLMRVSCVPDADGQGGLLCAFTDVTEERRMVRDLTRFRHLFQHANDIISVVDEQGRILFASPSNERLIGYPRGWRPRDGILGLVHPDDRSRAAHELDQLVQGVRGPEPFTVRVMGLDGEWRHVECVGVNLLDEPDVRGVVITSRDTTERERLSEQLAYLAGHDPLTDLPNRSVLEPRLEQALARTEREGTRIGLCFIDLDGFKKVNDGHGHAAGDAVLIEVADRIRGVTRVSDTAVRVGGDEFVVILDPANGRDGVCAAARRIRDAIRTPPITRGDLTVGASFGVALSEPGDSPSSLLIRADLALYRAKPGRNSAIEVAAESVLPIAT